MTAIKNIPPNRAVAVLTPLVFAPLAGAISVAAAKYLPGVTIDQGSLEAVFIAGATIALGPAGLWLKGWQAQEQRDAEAALAAPASIDGDEDPFAGDLDEPLEDDAKDAISDDEIAADIEAFHLDDETEPAFEDVDDDDDFADGDDEDHELLAALSASEG